MMDTYHCPSCGDELGAEEPIYCVDGRWMCEMELFEELHIRPNRPGAQRLAERFCRLLDIPHCKVASWVAENAYAFRYEREERRREE